MTNWDLREFCVRVNLPSPIRQVRVPIRQVRVPIPQVRVPIRRVITPIRGILNPITQVILRISHSRSYPPYRSHLYPRFLSFSSTTLPSSQNTKLIHPSLFLHAMIRVNTEYSIHLRLSVVPSFSRFRVDH